MTYAFTKPTKANRQRVLDRVAWGLARQGCRSTSGRAIGTSCAYRGSGRTSCAIGQLIPDSLYVKSIEGWIADRFRGALEHDSSSPYPGGARPEELKVAKHLDKLGVGFDFLESIQSAHDQPDNMTGVMEGLQEVAELYKLRKTAIKKAIKRHSKRFK